MPWFNKNHLRDAYNYSNQKSQNFLIRYFWHFFLSCKEGIVLFIISLLSFVHAVFPWIIDFELLKWRIQLLKKLKEQLPEDPNLKKISFDDTDQ